MKVTITGKQIDVGTGLRGRVETSLPIAVDRYFDKAIEAQVTLSRDGGLSRADISVHAGRGIVLRGHAEFEDAYLAFDWAEERIAKRLRRHKRRLREHELGGDGLAPGRGPETAPRFSIAQGDEIEEAEAGDQPAIILEMTPPIFSLSVGEAVIHMDLADLPALPFRDSADSGLNVVYRRTNGHIGWVSPPIERLTDRAGHS